MWRVSESSIPAKIYTSPTVPMSQEKSHLRTGMLKPQRGECTMLQGVFSKIGNIYIVSYW